MPNPNPEGLPSRIEIASDTDVYVEELEAAVRDMSLDCPENGNGPNRVLNLAREYVRLRDANTHTDALGAALEADIARAYRLLQEHGGSGKALEAAGILASVLNKGLTPNSENTLVEALSFYADPEGYEQTFGEVVHTANCKIKRDGGAKARTALEAWRSGR